MVLIWYYCERRKRLGSVNPAKAIEEDQTLIKVGKFWYVKYYDHTGKQVKRKGYSDKRQTIALANRLEDEKTKMRHGDIDPKHEQQKVERAREIEPHLADYKLALQAKGDTISHIEQAIADVQKFIDYTKAKGGLTHADAITSGMVDQWVEHSLKKAGDANRTINRRVGALKSFLKKLRSIGTISAYVLYKYPKLPEKGHEVRKSRALDGGEQAKLLTAAVERADLYRFCLGTGARHMSCSALQVQHVNFKEKTLTLKGKDTTHSGKVEYVIPMHTDLLPILKRLCDGKESTAKVFHVPVRSMASKLLRKDCKAAGVEIQNVTFHGLRHSFITTLAKANIHPNVAQALADHKNISITLGYYTHFKRSDERSALETMKL